MSSEWHYDCRQALGRADKAMDAFYEKFDILPPVSHDGSSECPYAEQIYRQAYEQEYFVRKAMEQLVDLANAAPEAIRKCQEALSEIDEDDQNAQFKRRNAELELNRHNRMVTALAQKQSQLRGALSDAKAKRYPGMEALTDASF